MNRSIAISGAFIAAWLLSACGGGSGGVNSGPTPPPPAPTNSTLVNLQYSQAFGGLAAANPYTVSAAGTATANGATSSRQIDVRYDAANQSYTIATGDRPDATFTPANRVAEDSTAAVSVYEKGSGTNNSELLLLFNPGPSNTALALTYTSYGAWQTLAKAGSSGNANTTYFVYGIPTAPADLPRTGTASYQTRIDGLFTGSDGIYQLGGDSSFSADFGAGRVSFSMSPIGQSDQGALKAFGTLSGTGTISAADAGFTADTGARAFGDYGVTMQGRFFGPAAAEVGATFTLTGEEGRGTGVLVGKK